MASSDKLITSLAALDWGKTIGLSFVVGAFYWLTMFDDGASLSTSLSQAEQEYAAVKKEISATKEAVTNADRFEKEVKDTVHQFGRITDIMPDKMNSTELTAILSDLCTKSNLKLLKVEPKSGFEKVDFYETTKVAFVIEGTFASILSFLSSMSRISKILTFDLLDLEVTANNPDLETPRLQAAGVLVGYRYTPVQSADPSPTPSGAMNNSTKSDRLWTTGTKLAARLGDRHERKPRKFHN